MREGHRDGEDRIARGIERDRAAFEKVTGSDLPQLSSVARAVRTRTPRFSEGFLMATVKKHPFLAPAMMTVGVLFIVMLLPISFDRTVGHDVTMTLRGGTALDQARVAALAQEMKSQLGADRVEVAAQAENGAAAFTFKTSVGARAGANAKSVVAAFEKALEAQGMNVDAAVTPRIERVSGTVAAYAADRVIRIETEGKSASQIESEIRMAFEQAGISDVQVSVTDQGEGKRRVEVKAERDAQAGDGPLEPPQIVLGDENANDADRTTVEVRKLKDESGSMSLKLTVHASGRDAEVTIPNVDSMSDGALESEIERQLFQAGVDLDATVTNGKISVQPR